MSSSIIEIEDWDIRYDELVLTQNPIPLVLVCMATIHPHAPLILSPFLEGVNWIQTRRGGGGE